MRGCAGAREDARRRLLCRAVVTEPRALASGIGTQLASPSRSDANWSCKSHPYPACYPDASGFCTAGRGDSNADCRVGLTRL